MNFEIKLHKSGKGWKLTVFKNGMNLDFYYTDIRDIRAKVAQLKAAL